MVEVPCPAGVGGQWSYRETCADWATWGPGRQRCRCGWDGPRRWGIWGRRKTKQSRLECGLRMIACVVATHDMGQDLGADWR